MNSITELKGKIRKLERENKHYHEKIERDRAKHQSQSKKLKYYRRRIKELKASRCIWKKRNKHKGLALKAAKKKLIKQENAPRHHYPYWLMDLCVQLRIIGCCSYRSIVRILLILNLEVRLSKGRVPCANTVENWVGKLGYYQLEYLPDLKAKKLYGLILDESIQQAKERVLLGLLIPYEKQKKEALSYEDAMVFYIGGRSSWTSIEIQATLSTLIKDKDIKIGYILSDQGSALVKSASLMDYDHLPDITHALASCLKSTFLKSTIYKDLMALISSYQYRCVHKEITYLRPGKQRTKARFMNQKPIIDWALYLLKHWNRLEEEAQIFFKDLGQHKPALEILNQCLKLTKDIGKILKTNGLDQKTLKQVRTLVKTFSQVDELSKKFSNKVEQYLLKYDAFLEKHDGCFDVCSDLIESVFGKYKSKKSSDKLQSVSLLDLEVPLYCTNKEQLGEITEKAIDTVCMSHLQQWKSTHSSENQSHKRRLFFNYKE